MSGPNCPSLQELANLALGRVRPELLHTLAQHVEQCPECQETIVALGDREDTLVAQIRRPPDQDAYAQEPECQEVVARAKSLAAIAVGASSGEPASPQSPPPHPEAELSEDLGHLGEYELLVKLGEGGMGAVYKARQTKLKKIVALKVLPKGQTNDPRAKVRFEREMEAVGRVEHPNVVRAMDAREIDGTTVLVMEYVEGLDLAEVVKRAGPLPMAEACELIRQAAEGLQCAHESSLVHRDIKPSNLMLTRRGQVKILDLGLALLPGGQANVEMTGSGQIMGTADYIAPEQAFDTHNVDIRADIYSLGCTLYKLLTGHAPFSGPEYENPMKKMLAHVQTPVPPATGARPDIPKGLVAVLDRMLAKTPADRFSSPAEVAAAIAPFAKGSDLPRLLKEAEDAGRAPAKGDVSPPRTEPQASSGLVGTDPSRMEKVPLSRTSPPARWESVGLRVAAALPQAVRRKPMAIVATAVGLSAVILFGVLFKLRTPEGTLVVEINDPGATVQVLNQEGKILVERKGEKGTVEIGVAPGKGRLRMEKNGVELFAQEFSLASGGKEYIKARWEAKTNRAADAAQPYAGSTANKPPALVDPAFQRWMKEVAALPADKQVQAVSKKLQELNPGFDGKVTGFGGQGAPRIENGVVTAFGFRTDKVSDISPVRALERLRRLYCGGSPPGDRNKFSDLSPLKGMPLTSLGCEFTQVSDLSPLKEMPLTELVCFSTYVSDLSPLKGMPLTSLSVSNTPASDLSPLKGMPLTELSCQETRVSDLSLLEGVNLAEFFSLPRASPGGWR